MSNKVFSGDFLKVLLALKESIMKDIHCSELAIIKEVYANNCNCSLLSNPEIKINAYKTKGTICRVGDIVLVAFSDNDFRSNLLKKDNDSQLQAIDSPIKHQLDYGIIISNLTIGLGGTNVKFIDDAITTTNLSNLDLNRLSEQKLNELKDSGLLTKNSLYMTPDVSEDETKANVDASNLTNENIASWADKFFPIGSIYISVNEISPASFLGGTWEQIKDRFLLGTGDTYANGSFGGEATHTLTNGEMPSHNHQLLRYLDVGTPYSAGYGSSTHTGILAETATTTFIPTIWVSYVGGNQAHNNMPPYLAVYIWKRVPDIEE